jgi:hypothetical protein
LVKHRVIGHLDGLYARIGIYEWGCFRYLGPLG